ncbi:MAG: hypothetical protein GY862_20020 [Gammaproteobacteria bacterium]|nr:hypothetical protein [Gammaproteobacteria bacterium]
MAMFNMVNSNTTNTLWKKMQPRVEEAKTLEEAAQQFVDTVYREFEESLALARMFISVPYASLPEFNRKFVFSLAEEKGIVAKLKDDTPVLSLVGTRGRMPDWNDRRKSCGHVGIPLVSAEFVSAIPMISRLLNDLGLGLDWLEKSSDEGGLDIRTSSDIAGTFFVRNACESEDAQKRKIIPMQDFVKAHAIHTVFGIGGRYRLGGQNIVAAIFFTKENFDKDAARLFEPMVNLFKIATMRLVSRQVIFSD